jgi:hypothetical protein
MSILGQASAFWEQKEGHRTQSRPRPQAPWLKNWLFVYAAARPSLSLAAGPLPQTLRLSIPKGPIGPRFSSDLTGDWLLHFAQESRLFQTPSIASSNDWLSFYWGRNPREIDYCCLQQMPSPFQNAAGSIVMSNSPESSKVTFRDANSPRRHHPAVPKLRATAIWKSCRVFKLRLGLVFSISWYDDHIFRRSSRAPWERLGHRPADSAWTWTPQGVRNSNSATMPLPTQALSLPEALGGDSIGRRLCPGWEWSQG